MKFRTTFVLLIVLAALMLVSFSAFAGAQKETGTAAPADTTLNYTSWEEGWDGPVEGKDEILPEINKRLGVTITLKRWIVTSEDDRKRQLALWTSTNDIPDWLLIPTDGYSIDLMNQAGDAGKIWEIGPSFQKATLEPAAREMAKNATIYFASQVSGKQYIQAGPNWDPKWTQEKEPAQEGVLIRTDWLAKVGMSYPKTPDEYYAALKAFKDKIPAVNGKPVIPLVLNENLNGYDYIRRWFFDVSDRMGDGYNIFHKLPDGTYTNFPSMDKLERFVVFMNRLYREGLLDPEAGTIKDSQYQEKMTSGRAGSTGTAWWNMNSYNDAIKTIDPQAMYVYFPMPKGPGVTQPVQQWIGVSAPSAWVFSKKTPPAKVDLAYKVISYMSSIEGMKLGIFGIEGKHWTLDKDGKLAFTKEFLDRTKGGDWNAGAQLGVGYYSMGLNQSIINGMMATPPAGLRPDMIESRKNLKGTIFTTTEPQDLVPPGPVQAAKLPAINNAWRDLFISAVLAGSEAECRSIVEGWPAQWVKLGGNDIVAEKNALMKKAK